MFIKIIENGLKGSNPSVTVQLEAE